MPVTLLQVTPYPVLVNITGDENNKNLVSATVRFVAYLDFNLNYEFTVELETGEVRHFQSRDVFAYPNPTWSEGKPDKENKCSKCNTALAVIDNNNWCFECREFDTKEKTLTMSLIENLYKNVKIQAVSSERPKTMKVNDNLTPFTQEQIDADVEKCMRNEGYTGVPDKKYECPNKCSGEMAHSHNNNYYCLKCGYAKKIV